jgi:LysM repeat protein
MNVQLWRAGAKWMLAGVLAAFLAGGCGPRGGLGRDDGEETDPVARRAMDRQKEGDQEGTIREWERVLERKPRFARAHLELGLLYDDFRRDYVRAIYHYQRYLELAPDEPAKERIQDLVRRAERSLFAVLQDRIPGIDERIRTLQAENAKLKAGLQELRQNLAEAKAASTAGAKKPEVYSSEGRAYVVKPGDTLARIAQQFYGNPAQWRRIEEANKGTLGERSVLKPGMTLVIPK